MPFENNQWKHYILLYPIDQSRTVFQMFYVSQSYISVLRVPNGLKLYCFNVSILLYDFITYGLCIFLEGLAYIMNDLFGGVVYAGIDTDKHRYPIGKLRRE